MKNRSIALLLLLCIFQITCIGQICKETIINKSYAELFFEKQCKKLDVFSEFKKLQGKLICHSTELDSLLMKHNYHICKTYNSVFFYNDKTPSLIFWIKSGKRLEYYEKSHLYKNNVFIVFQMQVDSTYLMTDYFYKPLNQGVWGIVDFKIFNKNDTLYLQQFGGNPYGQWGTEFEFIYTKAIKKWLHAKSNFYIATNSIGVYSNKRLIWSKAPTKKLPIEEVVNSIHFPLKEYEKVLDGAY